MRRRAILAGLAAIPPLPRPVSAQRGARRATTWIVPFTAGTIADVTARLLTRRMSQALGEAVVVENRPGASGTLGAEAVARAMPDGHTLLYGGLSSIAAAPHLVPGLRYDPRRDLAPVHGIGASPNLMMVNTRRPWTTLQEFVAFARAAPSAPVYASPGVGTASHLSGAILQHVTGIRLIHAPYANAGLALGDVAAGRADVIWEAPAIAIRHMEDGRLRALAVTGRHRVPSAPGVPTVAEARVPCAEMLSWAGVFVPARTPSVRIAQLAAALRESLRDPEVQRFFASTGIELWTEMDAARFGSFLAEELQRIASLIARLGTTVE